MPHLHLKLGKLLTELIPIMVGGENEEHQMMADSSSQNRLRVNRKSTMMLQSLRHLRSPMERLLIAKGDQLSLQTRSPTKNLESLLFYIM